MGAVALGFLITGGLSVLMDVLMRAIGMFPVGGGSMSGALLAWAAAYRMVFTVAGGYVTARVAPSRPLTHAVVLGVAGSVIAIVGASAVSGQAPGAVPIWYPLAIVAATLPCCGLGAILRLREQSPHAA